MTKRVAKTFFRKKYFKVRSGTNGLILRPPVSRLTALPTEPPIYLVKINSFVSLDYFSEPVQ